jgi:predicted transcriptional regulator
MTETREQIARCIRTTPGIHFNELVRTLDLAPGQVQYHLKRLRSTDSVIEERLYGQTHYYSPKYDSWERGALSLLRRETAGDIVAVLYERGTARPQTVVEGLDITRSTLEWHVNHLTEQEVVVKERDEHNHVTLALARPTETAQLLEAVTPSTPERMVDRFTRLTDRLLDGSNTDE